MNWVLWLILSFVSPAQAQCNGVFNANQVCGTTSASSGVPHAVPASGFTLQLTPGITVIQPSTNLGVLFDNNGVLGDSTSINSVAIGQTTPAAGTFTNLTATGIASLASINVSTASLSTLVVTSGTSLTALTISGGTSIDVLNVSGNSSLNTLVVTGTTSLASLNVPAGNTSLATLVATSTSLSALTVSGATSLAALTASGLVTLNSLTVTLGTSLAALSATGTTSLNANIKLGSASVIAWNADTGISRDSAAVIDFGNGTASSSNATLQMSSFFISGTPQFNVFTTGAGTQTFTNSPCAALTTERWLKVTIAGSTSSFFIPSCS